MNPNVLWYFRVNNPSLEEKIRIKKTLKKRNDIIELAHYQLESLGTKPGYVLHGYIKFNKEMKKSWFSTNLRRCGINEYKPVFLVQPHNLDQRMSKYWKLEGPWSEGSFATSVQ